MRQVGPDESKHGMWSSRWLFVLAAAGSAVGLGNIWKFPYVVGESGGGAFVVVYLVCIALVGIPIMMAEVLMGREGRQSPINSMRALVQRSEASGAWVIIGWAGVLAGFLILSYYAVIAGWAMYYVYLMANGVLDGVDGAGARSVFSEFKQSPWLMLGWHTAFMVLTVAIVGRGVTGGLEKAIRWFMPLLMVLLVVLVGYGVRSDGFDEAVAFLFGFDFSKITVDTLLTAMGLSFFTLSLGMGAIMAYGAYVPRSASITSTIVTIAVLDTVVALAAGLAIFPIVFSYGAEQLTVEAGPSLMFETVPLVFGNMAFGAVFGSLFFVLVSFAAITSAISLTEPGLAFLVEEYNAKRSRVAVSLGVICWALGIGTVLSFNAWSQVHIVGELTFFDFVDYVTQNIMLPLGGLFIALFAGFVLPKTVVGAQLGIDRGFAAIVWALLIKVCAPLGVLTVFVAKIVETIFPQ